MKGIKIKCLLWYSKVLSAAIAMLGVVSCAHTKRAVAEGENVPQPGFQKGDSLVREEIRLMYGVPPSRFKPVEHRVMYGPPPVLKEKADSVKEEPKATEPKVK